MNVQLALQDGDVYIIEVNPRASRTIPFVSKCIGVSLAKIAARCMVGQTLQSQGFTREIVPPYFSVKEAVFPFNKFPGIDPILGPEMKSTGEVMGLGATFAEAYGKAQLGSGEEIPESGTAFISVRERDKPQLAEIAEKLHSAGFHLIATRGTAAVISEAGIPVTLVNKVQEGRPHIVDMIRSDRINLIINTTEGRQAIADSSAIRSKAEQHRVYYTTTMAGGWAVCEALKFAGDINVRSLQALHEEID
jgi:carbamoyl-phosphate synthase large subunit